MEERYRTGESLSVIKVRLATTSSWRPAISKPPYFTALALWPWLGSYFGGGFFESSTRLWISTGSGEVKLHPNFEPCPLEVSTALKELSLRQRSIYQRRLLRRGWRCLPNGEEQLIDYPVIDWDQRGRMVRVEGGKVFVAEFQEGKLIEQALIDLNAAEPEPLEAPPWAKRWA